MRNLPILIALALVLAIPFALKPRGDSPRRDADETLVIISPHNEAIRYEFGRAFEDYHQRKTGRKVHVDWRSPGGTSEIARYLDSEYLGAFQFYWEKKLGRRWTEAALAGFDNPRVTLPDDPASDDEQQQARRAFLESNVSIGIDLFFGGGSYDFGVQAAAGRLVDCGVIAAHPELFNATNIPQSLGGEYFWDEEGRWVGTCFSAFGICYNTDVLEKLNLSRAPEQWGDLTDPALAGRVVLADPTKSGSATKAYEMLIQQQMQEVGSPEEGWDRAIRLIKRIGANARYFTEYSPTVVLDVAAGDAGAGMTIDFYGRFQSEAVRRADGTSRMHYVTPEGGSSVGVDPIGMPRGAPHPELAKQFIEFVLSVEGQKLWNFKVGTPGGPERYALRRLPIRRELYAPEYRACLSDPGLMPYETAAKFTYHPEWTGPLFGSIRFIVRVMCLDSADELKEAWRALIAADFPPGATKAFEDVSMVDYASASGLIRDALRSPDKIEQVRLAKELGDRFRENYRRVEQLAKEGK